MTMVLVNKDVGLNVLKTIDLWYTAQCAIVKSRTEVLSSRIHQLLRQRWRFTAHPAQTSIRYLLSFHGNLFHDYLFQRCSDCGGGGAASSSGKWRCKELFVSKRKTCTLNHTRNASMADLDYQAFPVSSLDDILKRDLDARCGEIFRQTLLSNLGVPEVLETGVAPFSTFPELTIMATQGWERMRKYILTDADPGTGMKRFVALRWCKPKPRKHTQKHATSDPDAKELAGFCLAEYDPVAGTLYITVLCPWAHGEGFESSTRMLDFLLDVVCRFRESENTRLQAIRPDFELLPLRHIFTMLFLSRESRLINYMERRRSFMPLEKYLEKYPDASPSMFPPHRPCYLPVHMQKPWIVLVKRFADQDRLTTHSARQ